MHTQIVDTITKNGQKKKLFNIDVADARGHSITTWTEFQTFWITHPPLRDKK